VEKMTEREDMIGGLIIVCGFILPLVLMLVVGGGACLLGYGEWFGNGAGFRTLLYTWAVIAVSLFVVVPIFTAKDNARIEKHCKDYDRAYTMFHKNGDKSGFKEMGLLDDEEESSGRLKPKKEKNKKGE
jgi:hypothetical protein